MNLIEFRISNGYQQTHRNRTIAVNPDHVVSVEDTEGAYTLLYLIDGRQFSVLGDYRLVLDRLSEGRKK